MKLERIKDGEVPAVPEIISCLNRIVDRVEELAGRISDLEAGKRSVQVGKK
jgi:hypothetical protein